MMNTRCVCLWTYRRLLIVSIIKLYEKLYKMGIRGTSLELIKSYLSNRKQCISAIENGQTKISSWEYIERGVPQGSILGPLLFLLYINDLPNVLEFTTTLFADDTSVVIRSPNPTD